MSETSDLGSDVDGLPAIKKEEEVDEHNVNYPHKAEKISEDEIEFSSLQFKINKQRKVSIQNICKGITIAVLTIIIFLLAAVILSQQHQISEPVAYESSRSSEKSSLSSEEVKNKEEFSSSVSVISHKHQKQGKEKEKLSQIEKLQFKKQQRQQESAINKNERIAFDNNPCKEEENFYHQYIMKENTIYYRTYYGMFFPTCDSYRVDMEKWSEERETIEWARNNLYSGDTVLYDCPNCKNFEEIVMLSRFIGSLGKLTLFNNDKSNCLNKVLTMHNIKNIVYVAKSVGIYQQYSAIICKNQDFFRQEVQNGLLSNPPAKLLVKLTASAVNSEILAKMRDSDKVTANKVVLTMPNCKDTLQVQPVDSSEGYYQMIRKDYNPNGKAPANEPVGETPWIATLNRNYEQYKKKLPSPSEKRDLAKVVEGFPVPLSKITEGSEEEKKAWAEEKQLILWALNRTAPNWVVYYEHNPASTNLYVVLNLASLLSSGKVLLRCDSSSKGRIAKEASKLGIKNIEFVDSPSERELSAEAIFTDNLQVVKKVAEGPKFDSQLLVGHFKEGNETSSLLYRLYVTCHIKKLAIFPSFYFGFQLFNHFFWHSENPTGFFQLKKSKYIIFTTWNQPISLLTPNRKYSIEEMIKVSSAQLKVINPTILPYFVTPEHPIHKAFQFLSAVHKSDYLRCYLLFNYGGGYADVKHMHFDMGPLFKKLEEGQAGKYAIGYPERSPGDVACHDQNGLQPACSVIRSKYSQLMGNGHHMHKKPSPITKNWFQHVHQILEEKYESLKKNPARHNRDKTGMLITVNGKRVKSTYPLRWAQLNGELLSRAQYANFGHYYMDLPFPIIVDYG